MRTASVTNMWKSNPPATQAKNKAESLALPVGESSAERTEKQGEENNREHFQVVGGRAEDIDRHGAADDVGQVPGRLSVLALAHFLHAAGNPGPQLGRDPLGRDPPWRGRGHRRRRRERAQGRCGRGRTRAQTAAASSTKFAAKVYNAFRSSSCLTMRLTCACFCRGLSIA
jgi:hypothetical protein